MTVRRAIVEPAELDGVVAGAALGRDTWHYFCTVLRLSAGQLVEVGDGQGRVATGRLDRQQQRWLLREVELSRRARLEPTLMLLVGLLKPRRWSMLVEKCVELGVAELRPILTARSAVRPAERERGKLVERWRRQAREACKQCRRAWATEVALPEPLDDALAAIDHQIRLVADAAAAVQWPDSATAGRAAALLVGPEGGLDDGERAAAAARGFQSVHLGGFTLRAETAALALVVRARDRLGLTQRECEDEAPCR